MKKKKKFVHNFDTINQQLFNFPLLFNLRNSSKYPIDDNSHSWFDIKNFYNVNDYLYDLTVHKPDLYDKEPYKCKQIQFFPTSFQASVIDEWIELYRRMMNKTIKFYRTSFYNKEKISTSFRNIRSNHLINDKQLLMDEITHNNIDIYSHSLDYAIKDVCTNVKSILSNLKNGHINHFNLRYIKKRKPIQLVKIEQTGFHITDNQIISKKMGTLKSELVTMNIDSDVTIIRKNNRYFILIPIEINPKGPSNAFNKIIGLDMGIRTYLTGFSQDDILEIGNNLQSELTKRLKKIDKINKEIIEEKKKRKAERKRNRKIQNQVDDMHWKSINYLTNNYDGIILGKLSTKSIVKNSMCPYNKRIAMMMRSYVFRERLAYKCNSMGKLLKIINESYTSKICSNCGNMKTEPNETKIYNCEKCHIIIDRDHNAAKNMLMLGIIKRSEFIIGHQLKTNQKKSGQTIVQGKRCLPPRKSDLLYDGIDDL